jgi:hypothetical protein
MFFYFRIVKKNIYTGTQKKGQLLSVFKEAIEEIESVFKEYHLADFQ